MITCQPIKSDFCDDQLRHRLIETNRAKLAQHGFEPGNSANTFFLLTGGTEGVVLDAVTPLPLSAAITIIAHSNNNSLAAALEITARLRMDGRPCSLCYLDAPVVLPTLYQAPQPIEPTDILAGKRIGVIGKPSDWLVASAPEFDMVKHTWGCELVDIPLDEVEALIQSSRGECTGLLAQQFVQCIDEPSAAELEDAEAVYIALKKCVVRYQLDALTIRCFDLVLRHRLTGCYALARLNAEGIPAGCEGDISAIAGISYHFFQSGRMPWMANPSRINVETNEITVAHCTLPLDMGKDMRLRSHFESGLGVAIEADIPTQRVVIGRLGGHALEQQWWAQGTLTQALHEPNLCRTQAIVRLDAPWRISDLLNAPLGNHLVVVMRGE